MREALFNFDAFVITSNPSLKDESIYHAEQLKTEIRKTNGMKVIRVNNNYNNIITITITMIMIMVTVIVMLMMMMMMI